MIALSLGFAPRTHAPPELNYDFAASVQTGLNPAVAYAISAKHNVVSVALPPPLGSKTNHTEVQFKCNDFVNQMENDRQVR